MPKELEDIVGFKLREPAATTAESRNLPPVWQAAVLGILVGYLYHTILWRLILNWWNDPNFSHGFFVPLFSIFVVWRERKRIGSLLPCPSWIGLPIMAGALGVLILGVLGAELFLSRSSFILLLAGLIIYFLGYSYFKPLALHWGFLFLMMTFPAIIFHQFTLPLHVVASQRA